MKLRVQTTGIAVAIVSGLMHLAWIVPVALGWGQRIADKVHALHFVADSHRIAEFSASAALEGVVWAVALGYVAGVVFAFVWNMIAK